MKDSSLSAVSASTYKQCRQVEAIHCRRNKESNRKKKAHSASRRLIGRHERLLRIVGMAIPLSQSDQRYLVEDEGSLVEWDTDKGTKIDRFDGRALLDFYREPNPQQRKAKVEDCDEEQLEFERWRSIIESAVRYKHPLDRIEQVEDGIDRLIKWEQDKMKNKLPDSEEYLKASKMTSQHDRQAKNKPEPGTGKFAAVAPKYTAEDDEEEYYANDEEFDGDYAEADNFIAPTSGAHKSHLDNRLAEKARQMDKFADLDESSFLNMDVGSRHKRADHIDNVAKEYGVRDYSILFIEDERNVELGRNSAYLKTASKAEKREQRAHDSSQYRRMVMKGEDLSDWRPSWSDEKKADPVRERKRELEQDYDSVIEPSVRKTEFISNIEVTQPTTVEEDFDELPEGPSLRPTITAQLQAKKQREKRQLDRDRTKEVLQTKKLTPLERLKLKTQAALHNTHKKGKEKEKKRLLTDAHGAIERQQAYLKSAAEGRKPTIDRDEELQREQANYLRNQHTVSIQQNFDHSDFLRSNAKKAARFKERDFERWGEYGDGHHRG